MTPEMQKELLARLDVLASKLGVTADHIWAICLRQAHVDAYLSLLTALACLIPACGFAWGSYRCWKEKLKESYSAWEFGGLLCGVLSLGFLIAFGANAYYSVTPLLNPDFVALQYVMSNLR
jgi:TRAP-type C4-dicarboxylate transport system permease small subunit